MSGQPSQLRELLERLATAEVRFVLVGGLAVNAWGYVRGTRDVDIVPEPSSENLARLEGVLRELGGRVEVGDRRLDASAITTFLGTGDRTLVATELGAVDVLQGLPQVPRFDALDGAATDVEIGETVVRVCSLEHLLEMKRASQRTGDRADLEALEAAQEDSEGGG